MMMTKLMTVLLVLGMATAAHALPAQLVLHLHDSQGHDYTYRKAVDANRFADGSAPSAGELSGLVTAASEKMADELGYTKALLGPDNYKVLGAVKVAGAWLERADGKEDLSWFRKE